MKKEFLVPSVEKIGFLSSDALMSYYDDNADVGDVVPSESGAGSGSNWGDF